MTMKVLITRPRTQSDSFADALRAAGFEPICFPVIEINSIEDNFQLERALSQIDKYDWIVFTSANGVEAFFDQLRECSSLPRIAAIGPKTAEALQVRGVTPDFVPEEYVAEAILSGLGDLNRKWVLLPRAEFARQVLPEAIVKAGGTAHEIVVYKTLPAQPDAEGFAALKAGVDVITFTSASTVQNFAAIAKKNGLDPLNLPNNPLFACIGPITEQAAREEGLVNIIVAKEYTTDGLIDAIGNLVN